MILRRSLLWGVGAALVLTMTPSLRAGLPPPPTFALDRIRDLSASVRARLVLKDDRTLARLNLVVSVEDGVANVWGPVPSDAVGRLAVARLESVRGIRRVQTHFYPEASRDENLLRDLKRQPDPPQRIEVSKPDVDTGQMSLPRSQSAAIVTQRHGRSATPKSTQVFSPRPIGGNNPETASPAAVPRPTRQPVTLFDRIAAVRQSDPRFRTIPISVIGSRITVQQGTASDEVVRDLLSRLRPLPGVTEVELMSQ